MMLAGNFLTEVCFRVVPKGSWDICLEVLNIDVSIQISQNQV